MEIPLLLIGVWLVIGGLLGTLYVRRLADNPGEPRMTPRARKMSFLAAVILWPLLFLAIVCFMVWFWDLPSPIADEETSDKQ
ncbi:hypothetical protein A3C96_01530 [Candidatus Uhrbacteria bacterium RIFCSPHIGHO2_02_FULL_60_10]|uniref:Uncharacterized protein n=1 Tax=Candidatus Uhrbacteria bacterium RIFCSPHIGHO2_02_FULL_60_10 TaxID=1802392 RepID=A0A1F7U5Y5_9BACT|nr:MAG: hypothetical protein A3C96_01530 [Candidatus Uhrbacteria bacterium RIFCSPHIGHO2_02_FULL_60_10]